MSRTARATPPPDSRYRPGLDLLRVVALAGVFVSHAANWRWAPSGWGISIFFVLSGYLITAAFIREREEGGGLALGRFWGRRVRRIVPAYLVLALFSFLVDSLRGAGWSHEYLRAVLTFDMAAYNAAHGHPATSMAHTWSLSVEQRFYLVWPLVFLAVASLGRGALRALLASVVVGCLYLRWSLALHAHVSSAVLWNSFLTRADALAVGALLASVAASGPVQRLRAASSRHAWLLPVAVALVLLSRFPGLPFAYVHTLGYTVTALLAAVAVVLALDVTGPRLVARLRPVASLTYPMYLFHMWGLTIGAHVGRARGVQMAAGVVLTVAMAAATEWSTDHALGLLDSFMGDGLAGGEAGWSGLDTRPGPPKG